MNQQQQKEPSNPSNTSKDSTNQSKESSNQKESSNNNKSSPSPLFLSYEPNSCSKCFSDVSLLAEGMYLQYSCCGKVLHKTCADKLHLNNFTMFHCPMCHAKNYEAGAKEEIKQLNKWVLQGKPWSQLMLGNRYHQGVGVTIDLKRASELYHLAADQGHHLAQFNLATLYERGFGVIQSHATAFKYYTMSAAQGFANAQGSLGLLYAKGTLHSFFFVLSSFIFIYLHFNNTTTKKHGSHSIHGLFSTGHGTTQDEEVAVSYFKLAADQGNCIAQYNLGNMYESGEGVAQSDELSFKYFLLAAEQGDAPAQYNAGYRYYDGQGVPQSYDNAREWFTKAAEQGLNKKIQKGAIANLQILDDLQGRSTDSEILCSKCNWPAKDGSKLFDCACKGAQYCNTTCQELHWKKHTSEHKLLIALQTINRNIEENKNWSDGVGPNKSHYVKNKSTKKQKPNDRCACGSKKKFKKCCGSKKKEPVRIKTKVEQEQDAELRKILTELGT